MTNHGGSAFPGDQGYTPEGLNSQSWDPGMTLRDYFAGQALVGFLSAGVPLRRIDNPELLAMTPERAAQAAFGFADAMLAERDKEAV